VKTIDLIVDMAEGDPWDDDLIALCSSAAICCGAHAGSPELARETAARCRARGVRVIAHPGYPDRTEKGRTELDLEDDSAGADLLQELSRQVSKVPQAKGIKLHGALYHQAGRSQAHAAVLTALLMRTGLPLVGWKEGRHPSSARAAGVAFYAEGFADRRLNEDGSMVSRKEPNAMLSDPNEIKESVLRLAPLCSSLCIHGDTPGCVEIAQMVRRSLMDEGWRIAAP
jgi:UPF0271 protein